MTFVYTLNVHDWSENMVRAGAEPLVVRDVRGPRSRVHRLERVHSVRGRADPSGGVLEQRKGKGLAHLESIEAAIVALCSGHHHRDPLFARQVAEGMHACYSNAAELLDDARILASNARVASTLSLTVLALEELAKVPMICGAASVGGGPRAWKDFWRSFGRHGFKHEKAGEYGSLMESLGKSPYSFVLSAEITLHLEQMKQVGFYVDCVDGSFRTPRSIAAGVEKVLDFLFAAVEERTDSFAQFHATAEASEAFWQGALEFAKRASDIPPEELEAWLQRPNSPESIPAAQSEAELAGRLRSRAAADSAFEPGVFGPANYFSFYDWCSGELARHPRQMTMSAVVRELTRYQVLMGCKGLPLSAYRASQMFKLLFGYVNRQANPSFRDEVMAQVQGAANS